MGFIDNIKVDRDLQIQTACVAFFLLIFPLYFFTIAAGTDSPAGMGGVGKYTVSGEMTYIDFDEGGEYIADGTSLTIDLNTDSLSDMEQEMNIVGVLVSMTYGEDETSAGIGFTVPSGQTQADTITGMATHLNFSNSADGQNGGGETGAHDASTDWYNSSMIGLMLRVYQNLNCRSTRCKWSRSRRLFDRDFSCCCRLEVQQAVTELMHGEDVSYTIQLIVLDYTIVPFVDIENI